MPDWIVTALAGIGALFLLSLLCMGAWCALVRRRRNPYRES